MPTSEPTRAIATSLAALAATAGLAHAQQALDLTASSLPYLTPTPEPRFCGCGKAHALWGRARAGLPISEGMASPATREATTATDLLSNDLDIEIAPSGVDVGLISGSNTMRVRSLVNGLTQFTFRLRGNFTVSSVTLNGSTPASATTPPANNSSYGRVVTLDRPYNVGEEFTVRIAYSGTAVSRGMGSIEFTQQYQNGPAVVSSLSEPYYAATWWPTKDGDVLAPGDNSDKAVGSIAITAPSTFKSVANGLLSSTTPVAGGKTKYRWTTNYPTAPYLFAFSTSEYNQWTQTYTYPLEGGGNASMPVEFSIYPASDTPANRAAWENVLPMLEVFRQTYGEYPFVNEKYAMYQFPFGGGMEHQTSTGMGGFWESVVAHELAHQWWGDNVTCKTWNDIWLNEGFASYSEALWEERKPGSTGQPALQAAMNQRRPDAVDDSVYVYDVTNVNRIFNGTFTYDKGGWVLHQLRHIVGDANFFETLRQYRAAFQGGAATTNDFRDVASAVSGIDLTPFFNQWVFGIGAPSYEFGWQNATINGLPYLRLSIAQTQNPAWGSNSLFTMPIDVRATIDTVATTFVVQNSARTQHYLIPLSGPADTLALDPQDWILIQSKSNVPYTNGPAKIVASTPAMDASLAVAPAALSIIFSEPVAAIPTAFIITGPSGTVPFAFAYNAATSTATLTPSSTLLAGEYTIAVSDSIITIASGLAIDAEGAAYPTGDGLPGGSASLHFSISAPACPADIDNGQGFGVSDNAVDINDLLYFLVQFEAGNIAADLDNDGDPAISTPDGGVDINDLLYFLLRFELGC